MPKRIEHMFQPKEFSMKRKTASVKAMGLAPTSCTPCQAYQIGERERAVFRLFNLNCFV